MPLTFPEPESSMNGSITGPRWETCKSVGNKSADVRRFFKPSDGLEPSTPSLPWRFLGVTRVHARSLATRFLLQIGLL